MSELREDFKIWHQYDLNAGYTKDEAGLIAKIKHNIENDVDKDGNKPGLKTAIEDSLFAIHIDAFFMGNTYFHWLIGNDYPDRAFKILEIIKENRLLNFVPFDLGDDAGKTILFFAIARKYMNKTQTNFINGRHDISLIQFLIENSDKEVLLKPDQNGNTPLHAAFIKRDTKTIEQLIARAKELDILDDILYQQNKEEKTPIEYLNLSYGEASEIIKNIYNNPNPIANETDWTGSKKKIDVILNNISPWHVYRVIESQGKKTTNNDLSIDDLISSRHKVQDSGYHYDWIIFPCHSNTKPYLCYENDKNKNFYKILSKIQGDKYVALFKKYTEELKKSCNWPIRMHKTIQFLDSLPINFLKKNFNTVFEFIDTVNSRYKSTFYDHYLDSLNSLLGKCKKLESYRSVRNSWDVEGLYFCDELRKDGMIKIVDNLKKKTSSLRLAIENKNILNTKDPTLNLNKTYFHCLIASDQTSETLQILETLKQENLLNKFDFTSDDAGGKSILLLAIGKKYMNTSETKDSKCKITRDCTLKQYYEKYNKNDSNLIKFLIENSSKEVLLKADKNGNTPLHIAIIKRDEETIKLLINRAKELNILEDMLSKKNLLNQVPHDCVTLNYTEADKIIRDIYSELNSIANKTDWDIYEKGIKNILNKVKKDNSRFLKLVKIEPNVSLAKKGMTHYISNLSSPERQLLSVRLDNQNQHQEIEGLLDGVISRTCQRTRVSVDCIRQFLDCLGAYAEKHPEQAGRDAGLKAWINNDDFRNFATTKYGISFESEEDRKYHKLISSVLQKEATSIFNTIQNRKYKKEKLGARSFRLGMLLRKINKAKKEIGIYSL